MHGFVYICLYIIICKKKRVAAEVPRKRVKINFGEKNAKNGHEYSMERARRKKGVRPFIVNDAVFAWFVIVSVITQNLRL